MRVLRPAFRHCEPTPAPSRSSYFLPCLKTKPILGLAGLCLLSGLVPFGSASADTALITLAPEVTRSLLRHPEVAEANARICQSIHRLGLSKAEAWPQLGLEISVSGTVISA